MKLVSRDGDGFLLLIGELHFCRIEIWVKFTADSEAGGGPRVGDQVDDGLISLQRSTSPVEGNP